MKRMFVVAMISGGLAMPLVAAAQGGSMMGETVGRLDDGRRHRDGGW